MKIIPYALIFALAFLFAGCVGTELSSVLETIGAGPVSARADGGTAGKTTANAAQSREAMLMSASGIFLDAGVVKSNPQGVKTVFVFFDPLCPVSQKLYKSDFIQTAKSQNVAVYWIPVSIFNYSVAATNTLVSSHAWNKTKSSGGSLNSLASKNQSIFIKIMNIAEKNPKQLRLSSPTLVWIRSNDSMHVGRGLPPKKDFLERLEKSTLTKWPASTAVSTFSKVNI